MISTLSMFDGAPFPVPIKEAPAPHSGNLPLKIPSIFSSLLTEISISLIVSKDFFDDISNSLYFINNSS